ncbi:MAG: hypothetical protein ABIR15_23095 [Chitinophagaceae bacterium]
MDNTYYLNLFQKTADQLDKKLLGKKQIEVATGIVLESVFLKLYKIKWANPSPNPLTSPSRIFFSVWINDKTIGESKIFYNIHALKLRQLKGYSITSRQLATDFRKKFKSVQKEWPNVSVDYGPLTLMEGWVKLNDAIIQKDILKLAKQFLEMEYMIDELMEKNKK